MIDGRGQVAHHGLRPRRRAGDATDRRARRARRPTWRRSSSPATSVIGAAATSTRSASCCTSCSPASARSTRGDRRRAVAAAPGRADHAAVERSSAISTPVDGAGHPALPGRRTRPSGRRSALAGRRGAARRRSAAAAARRRAKRRRRDGGGRAARPAAASPVSVVLAALGVLALLARRGGRDEVSTRQRTPFDKPPAVLIDRAQQALAVAGIHRSPDRHALRATTQTATICGTCVTIAVGERRIRTGIARPAHVLRIGPVRRRLVAAQPRRPGPAIRSAADHLGHDRRSPSTRRDVSSCFTRSPRIGTTRDTGAGRRLRVTVRARRPRPRRDSHRASRRMDCRPCRADTARGVDGSVSPSARDRRARRSRRVGGRQPVSSRSSGPWTRAIWVRSVDVGHEAPALRSASRRACFFSLVIAVFFVSRMQRRGGRGDRRGAFGGSRWRLLRPHHLVGSGRRTSSRVGTGAELDPLLLAVGKALFSVGMLCCVRRARAGGAPLRATAPSSDGTRLLQGQILDARVGRDVLIGMAGGAAIFLLLSLQVARSNSWPATRVNRLRSATCGCSRDRRTNWVCSRRWSRLSPSSARCGASLPSSDSSAC